MEHKTLTPQQSAELARLKSYFPYRIVWGALCPKSGGFVSGAHPTKRSANAYARKGWAVFIVN